VFPLFPSFPGKHWDNRPPPPKTPARKKMAWRPVSTGEAPDF
jgi:hypothetical protein